MVQVEICKDKKIYQNVVLYFIIRRVENNWENEID